MAARKNGGGGSRPAPLLDIEAVAERLGVGVRHVRRLVAEGRIPYVNWGHLLRFDPVAVEAWLQACRVEPGERPSIGRWG
jgi:excisionase family DNA binding protein